jgi:hypothetical protein
MHAISSVLTQKFAAQNLSPFFQEGLRPLIKFSLEKRGIEEDLSATSSIAVVKSF